MKNTRMASLCGLLYAAVLILATTESVAALKHFQVGGREGWLKPTENETSFYSDWATRRRFHVGDSLVFVYKNDSVLVVDKWSYYHCNMSDPIMAFDNGNSTVTLDRPGPFYFISGVPDHCGNGQRLLVRVMHSHNNSPPAIAGPPERSSDISPALAPDSSSGFLANSLEIAHVVIALAASIFMASCF